MPAVTGLSPEEIAGILEASGCDGGYADRIAYWVYKRKVRDIAMMTSIAGEAKRKIAGCLRTGIVEPSRWVTSSDGSVRYVFDYGNGIVAESVFIPDKRRNTVCVSVQCGCAMGCAYCRTGSVGLHASLTAGEIVNQVMAIPVTEQVTHVVFMGMGEPLDNLEEVVKAVNIMTAGWGLAIGHANITVSTVGILPALPVILESTRSNLVLSLLSAIPEERVRLVPAERLNPASEIVALLRNSTLSGKRRISIAYMMLEGINDSDAHLESLIGLVSGSSLRINLLKYHPHGDLPFRPSVPERMEYFRQALMREGISVTMRKSRGEDIAAACGLLTADMINQEH